MRTTAAIDLTIFIGNFDLEETHLEVAFFWTGNRPLPPLPLYQETTLAPRVLEMRDSKFVEAVPAHYAQLNGYIPQHTDMFYMGINYIEYLMMYKFVIR